jgi:hypothetical protein
MTDALKGQKKCKLCSPSADYSRKPQPNLPNHLVWPITLSEAESAAEVANEVWFLLDGSDESLIDGLLVCCAAARWLLLLFIH